MSDPGAEQRAEPAAPGSGQRRCVVLGATGYIGGRLVPELLRAGHVVRAAARTPEKLADVPWRDRAEVVRVDVGDADSVAEALVDQDVVYYLVHSLHQRDYVDLDREAARTVAEHARAAGVERIVYLGGITPEGSGLSSHLASRAEVGEILLESGVPTIVLRAAIILGSGSASFEMLRYLTEHLPVMVTPKWVHNRVQPIAVRDVLHYLTGAVDIPAEVNRGFDIGGPDVLTYRDMMRRYAAVAELPRRVIIPVPVLTPWLSAQWVRLVTPVPHSIAVPLVESQIHEVVAREHDIAEHVPDPAGGLISYERAVELALARIREADVPTRWSDATAPFAPSDPLPTDPEWSGGTLYQDVRVLRSRLDPARVWEVIASLSDVHGRFALPLGRPRTSDGLLEGKAGREAKSGRGWWPGRLLGTWRVERSEPPNRVRARAASRLPGHAWFEVSITEGPRGGSVLRQRLAFEPHGLAGHLAWFATTPLRALTLRRMARQLLRAAGRRTRREDPR